MMHFYFYLTVTWIILSEIYPPAIRGRAVALVTVINWAANFIVSSMFLQVICKYKAI